MIEVKQIHSEEIFIVNQLAHQIWPTTFKDILSEEQIKYMLDWMYDVNTLQEQVKTGFLYYLLTENGKACGFLGLEPNFPDADYLRIHKLYVLPEKQGKGFGRELFNQAMNVAFDLDCHSIHLNVNRFNKASEFYQYLGFKITKEEDIDIGKGFLMEDFVMELRVKK
ncbi:MAG: GNAT family N-acetyltransferase [Fluviicola sp.]|nr:GNAT family N-acetyltransferase [Fluviicola sp.]